MREGKKFEEGHYYGYFRNLASHRWWKLDDEDVDNVHEMLFLVKPMQVTPAHSCCNMSFKIQSLIEFA